MRLSIAVPGNCQEILARVLAKPGLASAKALIVGRSWEIKRFEGFKPIQRESRIVVDCIQSACCVNKRLPPHPAPLIARRTDAKVPEDRKIDGRDVLDLLPGNPDAKSPHDVHYYDVDAVRRGPRELICKGKTFELYNALLIANIHGQLLAVLGYC
jgi:hypothetical protein